MLRLSKIRLVNWHYFTDSTLEIGFMTLLAGDNGSGKSTIIDAIQYALAANVSKIRFNSSAQDRRASRTLEGYCLCKIGTESVAYRRSSCTTHVILEWTDGAVSFCSGIMVEADRDNGCGETPWILDGVELEDVDIYDNGVFVKPSKFRESVRGRGGLVAATKREYNAQLAHRLKVHFRNAEFNPYFEAVIRSVTFKPLDSVHDFVCNYILEERNVDISAMKENLENYKLAEREAVLMEGKIARLTSITEKAGELEKLELQVLMQEYYKRRLESERARQELAETDSQIRETERDLATVEESIRAGKEQRERLITIQRELMFALSQNDEHLLYERLLRDREELRSRLRNERQRAERRDTLRSQCEALLGRPLSDEIEPEREAIDRERTGIVERQAVLSIEETGLKERLSSLGAEVRELEAGNLRYPDTTTDLVAALAKAGIPAQVFADQLEITDSTWQNAIEGWLNTQRFNVLVPEHEFQRAIELYNGLPVRTAGVGIPNLHRMRDAEVKPGSLAELVVAATPGADRYAAFLLGDVIRAGIENLKQFDKSVTRDCMRYASHTASRMKEDVYSRWYIGREAKRRRLAELRNLISRAETEIEAVFRERRTLSERLEVLGRVYAWLYPIQELSDAAEKLNAIETELASVETRLESIDTSGFQALKLQIAGVEDGLTANQQELETLIGRRGAASNRLETLGLRRIHCESEAGRYASILEGFLTQNSSRIDAFESYYTERIREERKAGRIDYTGILSRYDPSIKGITTKINKVKEELVRLKQQFNDAYLVSLPTGADGSAEHRELLETYLRTELPEYREKISRARADAEKQFREHFVSRLVEYIDEARESFKHLNYILTTSLFGGRDQYLFHLQEDPSRKGLLEVFRKATEVRNFDGTLFAALVTDEERKSVESVFESILRNDAGSEEVRNLVDYRRYFLYDIRIRHMDMIDSGTGKPMESSLSKVLREKSGGETQTPYYVAIAASFYRFYREDKDAVRLVLFDEAFNRMDDLRIENTIDFFRKIGMQVITAVPPEKIELIAPFMDRTLLVLRSDFRAAVREYSAESGRIPEPSGMPS